MVAPLITAGVKTTDLKPRVVAPLEPEALTAFTVRTPAVKVFVIATLKEVVPCPPVMLTPLGAVQA